MNGNALKLRRAVEKHKIIGLDTAPFIYYIEDVTPYADLLDPVYTLLESYFARHHLDCDIRRDPHKNFHR